jgi:hypothetical protein
MKCLEMIALMPYRALDCLETDEKESLDRHLEGCERCAGEARKRDDIMKVLAEPIPGEPSLDAVWERVKSGVAAASPRSAEPAAEASPAVDVTIALVCSFCHDVLARNEACYCASCLAPHHDDCFKAHGRCSAYGCDETATVRPRRSEVPLASPAPRRKRRRAPVLAVAFALAGGVAAVAALVPRGPRLVSLHVQSAPLAEVVAAIVSRARTPIFVDQDVSAVVTLDVTDRPWREALDEAARDGRCVVRPLGDGALVVEDTPRVTIQFTDANVRTVLQLLAAYSGKNIIVSPEVHGDVTLNVHEVPWDDGLRATMAVCGDYVARKKGDVIRVVPRSDGQAWGDEDMTWPSWPERLEPGAPEPSRLDLDVDDADIRGVCARLAEAGGRPIVVAPGVSGRVTIHARNASWRALLAYAARMNRVAIRERNGAIHVEDVPKVTLQFTDANVRTVIDLLAANAGVNVVIAPEVRGDVTLDLHEVFYDDALEALVSTVGDYEVVHDGENMIRVVARSTVAPGQVFVKKHHVARGRPVLFPGGRTVDLACEGVLAGPQGSESTRAVISGRVYEKGDTLRTDQGKTMSIVLAEIHDDEIVLEDQDDPSHPRVTVAVGGRK